MNLYFVLPLLAFGFNLVLVPLVLRRNLRSALHRVFCLFLLSMSVWGLTIYRMRSSPTPEDAFLWEMGVFASVAAASLFFLHFTFLFTMKRPRWFFLPTAYLIMILLIPLILQGLVVTGMHREFYGYAPTLGFLFPLFLLYVYYLLFMGFRNMLNAYRSLSSPETRNRYAYVMAGALCSVIGATTDYLPPLGVPIYPLGIVGNIAFSVLTTIAILRHRLLDIRIAIRTAITYFLLCAIIGSLYVAVALLFLRVLQLGVALSPIANIIAVVVLAAILQALVRPVQGMVDRWFHRERYAHLIALERFGRENRDIVDLELLSSSLIRLVALAMQVKVVTLLQPSPDGGFVTTNSVGVENGQQISLSRRSPLLSWIRRREGAFATEELYSCPQWQALPATERETWIRVGGELYVPLKAKGGLTGLLVVGSKESGDSFAQEDVALLQAVAYQAATNMENARLYQELKVNLEELQRKEAQLVESAKLASVGTLAAGVAHEVNNPIFAISGRAELLLDQSQRYLKTKKAHEHVQVIYDMAMRVSSIVQDLLAFSRERDALEDVDVNEALEGVLKLVIPNLKRSNILLLKEYDKSLCPVSGVRNKLQQVFTNLILNAQDAMPGGGRLRIATYAMDGDVALRFADTGAGIPPEVMERLFDPFFTTKEVGKGTGLGLYVSRRIVQQHRGRIEVETREEHGSTFTVYLPASQPES
ncbi:MAG: ATP-binding protein [Chloroflexota bacterium]